MKAKSLKTIEGHKDNTIPLYIDKNIWSEKYKAEEDNSFADTIERVARAVASVEKDKEKWENEFIEILHDLSFIPGGRILKGAGTGLRVTLNNCYVMGDVPDDMSGIMEKLRESALTMQAGGGIGMNFSTLRPRGAAVKGVGSTASGPVSFMRIWDSMCETIKSTSHRRGAQIGILRVDHPDIEEFIEAKRGDENSALRNFNLSVAVTDEFMRRVKEDMKWKLMFGGRTYKTIRARDLWDRIMKQNYNYAEPGVLFIDRINEWNNLHYCERLTACNPCGEQPLPEYSACCLGSINLTRFVNRPFEEEKAEIDTGRLGRVVSVAVRFLDNVVDISWHPLEKQREAVKKHRRIGLGITGLADTMAMLGLRYGSQECIEAIGGIMRTIRDNAYLSSVELAREKGRFPLFSSEYTVGTFIKTLPGSIRRKIEANGIRNSHLLTVAPTGTTSLLAGNISSGIEPIFALSVERHIRRNDGGSTTVRLDDYAWKLYRDLKGDTSKDTPPDYFVTTSDITPEEHIAVQAAVQKYVDASISKTINLPEDISFEDFKNIYLTAYEKGIKGCTVYREGSRLKGIITQKTNSSRQRKIGKERPYVLEGRTYKIKNANSKHALYVTINDIVDDAGRRPFEIFLNTKDPSQIEWMMALTRLMSAVFRRTPDPSFLIEELKVIHSPLTGFFSPSRRKFVPSLMAEIGEVISDHLADIGIGEILPPVESYDSDLSFCPECNKKSLIWQEGCAKCTVCGYTKC